MHWSHGGRTDPHNLLALCALHHRMVHCGLLTIDGDPADPAGLTFTDHRGRRPRTRPTTSTNPRHPDHRSRPSAGPPTTQLATPTRRTPEPPLDQLELAGDACRVELPSPLGDRVILDAGLDPPVRRPWPPTATSLGSFGQAE